MDSSEIIKLLNQEPEMNPDLHDGSYELMRDIVDLYSSIDDYSVINFRDLNAVYAMVIGTWKLNVEKKKEYVNAGHLSYEDKEIMADAIDDIWDKACRGKYTNREGKGPSIGMFGTGFYSFERNTNDNSCQKFIEMLVDIAEMSDDDQMFDRVEQVFNVNFKGMQAAVASVMLHCLKPNTFPILNANYGAGTIYSALGINIQNEGKLVNYIDNCRKIKQFRDSNLTIKNYRILDCFPRNHNILSPIVYFPSLEEYDPGISQHQYVELLQDTSIVNKQSLDTVFYIYDFGGEATCSSIANKYGNTPYHYNSNATHLAKAIQSATNCPMSSRDDNSGDRYWAILFQGRYVDKSEQGRFSWKLRQPLYEAIAELDENGFFDDIASEEKEEVKETISKNTILYGPPGTGKTFNTVIYSVAIIENKSIDEIKHEASENFTAVKARYDTYKKDERIAFVTFHQSYGYEEFIEGIKPNLDESDSDESKLEYSIESGVFKRFCERAEIPKCEKDSDFGLNNSPVVWKISLEKTGDNPTRRECLDNNHIRIGWDGYGQDITDNIEYDHGGKTILNAFIYKMRPGDFVLSCYSSSQIDAIGIITGDYEWHPEYEHYKRVRKVKWLAKDIREDIVEINNGHTLVESTVYKLNISPRDVLDLASKYLTSDDQLRHNDENYVFIIDEINRGNISKIFGELITLIEENKRIGMQEEITAKLPYSHESFGVPGNVYILGTMNTADRSIAIMDTALRRRFSFVEMLPDSDVLRQSGNPTVYSNGISVTVADMLDIINDRITFLYDREHTIGHAFFMPLKDTPSIETLAQIFEKSIIPLLQEYFYEDYAKIQLVLGDDGKTGDRKQYQFISDEEIEANKIFETVQELDSEKKYSINYPAFRKIESYKFISKKL